MGVAAKSMSPSIDLPDSMVSGVRGLEMRTMGRRRSSAHDLTVCGDSIDVEEVGIPPRQSGRIHLNRSSEDGYVPKHAVQGYSTTVVYRSNLKRKISIGRLHYL
jgi:hypothetical protein